ncbi:uncharacterized protein LOC132714061 [Ruditapes philippinarum]|uniref:uncharacterized protein LOC132714061 n=1 Tax=Ruditapes philippinarum TaxID=129788 RepID=UPI00295A5E70|nr:uncharacterized protein LOC132714061 [Ruditapes philippinarum]
MDTGQQDNSPVTDPCVAQVTSSDLFTHDNESANAYVPEMEMTSEETQKVVTAEQKRSEEGTLEIQVFRSVEEAYSYIANYEIATNNKFVCIRKTGISRSDVQSLDDYRIIFNYTFYVGDQKKTLNDGMATVCLGTEEKSCQYGRNYRKPKGNRDENAFKKTRNVLNSSKKLGCHAVIRIKKVLKFPDYNFQNTEMNDRNRRKMVKKLRLEFSEETKRFILVYVHIETNHNHPPCPVQRRTRYIGIKHKISKGCKRIPCEYDEYVGKGLVLKRKSASLKGKDLSNLALQFKNVHEIPALIARPRKDQKLEDMDIHELMLLYYEITGQVPNEMFAKACKPFIRQNLILLLHLCIVFANASMDKQTHISVRLKGTEREFTPVECYDEDCAVVDLHMHCPFCSKTDSYTDVSLLKAHYTKQHVDKALEFSGMKILRCYDTCIIDGKHVCNKTFKGGHWHCFACSNAIERRVDCFAHYKRHLNDFGSSFQVCIAQDVNPASANITTTYEIQNTLHGIEMRMSDTDSTPDFRDNRMYTMPDPVNISPLKYVGGHSPSKRSYTDTGLGVHDDVLYVEEDEHGNVLSTYTAQPIPTAGQENVVVSYPEHSDVKQLKTKNRELEMKIKKFETQNVLQKSYVDFLEKTICDLKEEHSKEVETLKAENENLRKGQGVNDESTGGPNEGGESVNSSHGSFVRSAVSAMDQKSITRTSVSTAEINAPVNNSLAIGRVEDQLSQLRNEVAGLRNNINYNISPGINLVRPCNPPYFLLKQGLMTPCIFPENMTGLVNTNLAQNVPVKMFQNTATLNLLPLNSQQKVFNTPPVSSAQSCVAKQNTEKCDKDESDIDKGRNKKNVTDNCDTNSKIGNIGIISNVAKGIKESTSSTLPTDVTVSVPCIQTENIKDTIGTKMLSKEVQSAAQPEVVLKSIKEIQSAAKSEVVLKPMQKEKDNTVNDNDETCLDNPVSQIKNPDSTPESSQITTNMSIKKSENGDVNDKSTILQKCVTRSLSSVSSRPTCTVEQSTSAVVSSKGPCVTSSIETANSKLKSSTSNVSSNTTNVPNMPQPIVDMLHTTPTPVLMVPNKNFMNPFIVPQNIPLGLNVPSIPGNLSKESSVHDQKDQFVVVQGPTGCFLLPRSSISGLDQVPSTNTSAFTNTVPLSKIDGISGRTGVQEKTTTTIVNAETKTCSSNNEKLSQNSSVDNGKNKSKLDFGMKSTSEKVKGEIGQFLLDKQSTAGTSIPCTVLKDSKSATKERYAVSRNYTTKTNKPSPEILEVSKKELLSLHAKSLYDKYNDATESVTETPGPAKKRKLVVLKVDKNMDKSALNDFLKKHKIFLKKESKPDGTD